MEPISPELALVDPELARVARALLPPPRDCLASLEAATAPPRVRPLRPSLLMTVLALQLVVLVGSLPLPGHGPVLHPALSSAGLGPR